MEFRITQLQTLLVCFDGHIINTTVPGFASIFIIPDWHTNSINLWFNCLKLNFKFYLNRILHIGGEYLPVLRASDDSAIMDRYRNLGADFIY